jgi:hypothetical protein
LAIHVFAFEPCGMNHFAGNRLLPLAQMIVEQFASGDVASVHALYRMVHEQVDMEIGDTCSLGHRPVRFAEAHCPTSQDAAVFLVLGQMPTATLGRKQSFPCPYRIENAPEAYSAH